MSDMPWDKFYWTDWECDEKLRMCSPAAQGLWMRMLCICSRADGYLMIADKALDASGLQRVTGWAVESVTEWLQELATWQVFSVDRRGVIFSRRMVKAKKKARNAREVGVLGGNPTLCKDTGNPPKDNLFDDVRLTPRGRAHAPAAQKLEARSQKLESKNPPKDKSLVGAQARGSRLSESWAPTAADLAHAVENGFSPIEIQRMSARFKNYWLGAAGKNAVKVSWAATWRNWVDREATSRAPAAASAPPPHDRFGVGPEALSTFD